MTLVGIRATREGAARTLENLIRVHQTTVSEIDQGKRYWKRGEDVTAEIRKRCLFEIEQCKTVQGALEHMREGNVQRAVRLCEQIRERIPNVN